MQLKNKYQTWRTANHTLEALSRNRLDLITKQGNVTFHAAKSNNKDWFSFFYYYEVLLLLDAISVFISPPPPHILYICGASGGAWSEANV